MHSLIYSAPVRHTRHTAAPAPRSLSATLPEYDRRELVISQKGTHPTFSNALLACWHRLASGLGIPVQERVCARARASYVP